MPRPFKALSREMSDPSLNNPILATISHGILNFFHSNWKVFDKNSKISMGALAGTN
jgi:hypothetical protein